jgi:serine/threonine protein kinase
MGKPHSDLFSLAVITYQMLTGKLPYSIQISHATTKAAQRKLQYTPLSHDERNIPIWIDGTLRKALQPDPYQRYSELSEFIFDLRHPNKQFLKDTRPPLLERDPVSFWKGVSLILTLIIIALLSQ